MAGLVPAIHDIVFDISIKVSSAIAWMPGTRPGMTVERL